MAKSKPHPWFDQVLKLNLNPCESCGALCDLFEKPSSTGEYVPGDYFEIKSRTKNVALNHGDICESCLVLAKTAIILRPSLYKQGISDSKPLLANFVNLGMSEGVINATVAWVLSDGLELLTRQFISISQPKDASASVSIAAAKEDRLSAKSEQNLGFIRNMLSLCETGHGCCHRNYRPGGDGRLPTRLVAIEDQDCSIRLYEPDQGQQGSYAALSHCWGPREKHPPRTLQGNIDSMKSEIPWRNLSALFKDSIWLCRQLGIKYIWIDSLCIVQDDDTDWEVESARMAQYYSEARVTIAVDSSADGTTPFLSQRAERWQPQTSSSAPYLIVREKYSRAMETSLAGAVNLPSYFPEAHHFLPTRAWALQESILSTRVVHFTPSDITWECDGMTVSEDGFQGGKRAKPFFSALENTRNENEQRAMAWRLWAWVVAEFTSRDITYAADRLPALSGMASRFQSIIGGRYLAGIWENYLTEGLSWARRLNDRDSIRAPGNKLAPTWSWVSMSERARVEFHPDVGIPKLPPNFRPEVLEAHCETSKDSPFGRVQGGHMLIKAPLFKATLTYDNSRTLEPGQINYMATIAGNNQSEEPYTSQDLVVDCLLVNKHGNALRAHDDDHLEYLSDPPSFTATAWIMWLGSAGLVLGQDPDSRAFQRLGYLATSSFLFRVRSSPIDDPQRWTNSLEGTVMQFLLV